MVIEYAGNELFNYIVDVSSLVSLGDGDRSTDFLFSRSRISRKEKFVVSFVS